MANAKTNAKVYTMEVVLTKAQWEALEKSKPTHKRGNDEGSFNACKKACGYAFCGGKENYDKTTYEKGQFLFMEKYGSLLRDASFPSEAPKADEKPTASRGKSKKSDGFDIDNLTKAEKEAILKKLLGL
jgi:hypothetical protein